MLLDFAMQGGVAAMDVDLPSSQHGSARGKGQAQSQPSQQTQQHIPPNVRPCLVHRCRFIADVWKPHAITALAYAPSGNFAAVARDNGSIEVWNTRQGWFAERVIPGTGESLVQSLVWVPGADGGEDRLFSAGGNARIVEWDLEKLVPKVRCSV